MDNTTSGSFLLHHVLLLCLPLLSFALITKNIKTDQSALLALKSQITLDPNSTLLFQNWTITNNNPSSVCNWIGVQCSSSQSHKMRVVALNLSNFGLQGTIPPQLGNLSFLNFIDISGNNFQGKLPQENARLKRLRYINLSRNNFSGEVPLFFGSLPNLQYLFLANNSFSGTIPPSLFNATYKLEVLSFHSNSLEGNIPKEIGNLRNLRILNLQFNHLSGSLPPSLFNISALEVVALSHNELSGNLPTNICSRLSELQGMFLSYNRFSGQSLSTFSNCSEVAVLSLSYNNFSGPIPGEIGNLTMLNRLLCGFNNFQGSIPAEIGNLQNLMYLEFTSNSLSGQIPGSIFNRTSLLSISFPMNNLSGNLPFSKGMQLPNLDELLLSGNELTGVVLESTSNFTTLTVLDLEDNHFSGSVPSSIANLEILEYLSIRGNHFTSKSSPELEFLASWTNCRSLSYLDISENRLNGTLLPVVGNFSSSLEEFHASSCGTRGKIPHEIGNLSGLSVLELSNNNLTGQLPWTFRRLSNLQALNVEGNRISGSIPNYFCNLKHLFMLRLSKNQYSGQVPECIGNITSLRELYLDSNSLNSTLPATLGGLSDLLYLDVHSNYLSGYITPEIGNLKAALSIDLSDNEFSGNIPTSIGGLGSLINLSLAHNQLQGPIPENFGDMLSIESLDLSRDNLIGEIPTSLESLLGLKYFNVSFNDLQGEIPANGSFLNFTVSSFMSNKGLCGGSPDLHFHPCDANSSQRSVRKRWRIVAYILIPTGFTFFSLSILLVYLKKQKGKRSTALVDLVPSALHERISYYELQTATNAFSESNLLATGSCGSVYKGVLKDGTTLAVKVFNLELEVASQSFERECEVLRNIRHRNLVKVISSCCNLDFKALVLEYMPNESLERWLYSYNCCLDFLQRLDIMIDVASALDYLHNGYSSPIVHCDLKPSNVLLDKDMIGHVSDFGISRLFREDQNMAQTKTLATIGYIAPEYGSEGIVSTSCDMYSFGILLMETFSRKKPTDEMFSEDWGLKEWVKAALQNSTTVFIDYNLVTPDDENSDKKVKCTISIMELAVRCTEDSPEQRTGAKDALAELQKAKTLFLSF